MYQFSWAQIWNSCNGISFPIIKLFFYCVSLWNLTLRVPLLKTCRFFSGATSWQIVRYNHYSAWFKHCSIELTTTCELIQLQIIWLAMGRLISWVSVWMCWERSVEQPCAPYTVDSAINFSPKKKWLTWQFNIKLW